MGIGTEVETVGEDSAAEDETKEVEVMPARDVLMVHGEECTAGFQCD